MNKKQATHAFGRQQWWLFLSELISFALIFLSLGTILWRVFQPSIYQGVDRGIRVQRQLLLNKPVTGGAPSQDAFRAIAFRTSILVFDHKGKLLNGAVNTPATRQQTSPNAKSDSSDANSSTPNGQDNYTAVLQQLKLNKGHLNELHDVRINQQNNFRTLTFYVPKTNSNLAYAGDYLMIVTNTDSEKASIEVFKRVLTWSMLIFWVISILLSYVLARLNMRPILRSWQLQREFVANAAHELRTPLTVIQNKLELMLTHPNDKIMDQTEQITLSLSEVRRLNSLTSDLLLLARSDSNMTQIRTETVSMKAFLTEVSQPYSEIAASQDKQFTEQIDLDRRLTIDKQRIHQLIVIFLDNALKYTEPGDTVTLMARVVGTRWELQIKDTGIGIADSDKPHVFDRFYRVDKSRSRATGGNGLGLSIAKWIADSHRGRISITDNVPHGTIFTISFPLTHPKS